MISIQNNERSPSVPESIYRALIQLMAETPYAKITVTDICRRAGVSRMAYYRHYSNRQEIFFRALEQRLDEVYDLWQYGQLPTPLAYWTAYFAAMRRDDLVPMILKAKLAHDMDQYLFAHARKMIAAVEGWDLSQQDPQLHLFFAFSASAGLVGYGLFVDPQISDETLAEYMVQKTHT